MIRNLKILLTNYVNICTCN